MKAEPIKAWQPLTFGGVARYAHDWIGRLIVTCLVVSLITAAAVIWTAGRTWSPVIQQAIENLPAGAEIRGGRLQAPGPARLAESRFLAIALEPRGASDIPSTSDLHVTLAANGLRFRSLFGTTEIPYRPEWTVVLNRADLEPWWGAWRPQVMAYLGIGTIVLLFASWLGLGILYALLPFLIGVSIDRVISLWGSFKLAVAALMPGAIFQTVAIVFYGLGNLRVPEMIGGFALHFIIGWIFLIGATFQLPLRKDNPFEKDSDEGSEESDASYGADENSSEAGDNDFADR